MSILIISDVHASTSWKKIFKERQPNDIVIFLGDYFDKRGRGPFARSQTGNFLEIVEYARNNPDTILLIGNHEYFYLPWANDRVDDKPKVTKAILDNLDILRMVYVIPEQAVICSHGGITNTFMKMNGLSEPEKLNDLWREHPEYFDWKECDPISGECSSWIGDDIWQSPIWARTDALKSDGLKGWTQIVGHTPVAYPDFMDTKHGDKVFMTCCFSNEIINFDIAYMNWR